LVERFSWEWFDQFWQIVALLIGLSVLGLDQFKVMAGAADLPPTGRCLS
jgi:membrane protein YqaA with SNARE-associated domain